MAFVLRPPGSRESISDTLADLGRFRKSVALIGGVFAFAAALGGGILLACVLDAIFHLTPVVRGIALASVLTLAGVVWLRGVSRAMKLRTDALGVALELEDRYPSLNDSLASAVEFLDGPDAEERGISERLQTVAVRQARRAAERHDLDRMANTSRAWRSAWACAFVAAALVPLVLTDTTRAGVALVRLADPFGHHPWPTKTRVEILAPELPARMPKGEPFDLKFVVRGVIKDRATVTFRIQNGEEFTEQYPLSAGNDPRFRDGAVVAARVEGARLPSSFTFKIASNDGETDWKQVEVVPPPRLVPFSGPNGTRPSPHFHVTPPPYTGQAPHDLPDGASVLEIPAGSVVRMRAAADVRLSAAALAYTGDRAPAALPAGVAAVGNLNPFAALGQQQLADLVSGDIPVSLDDSGKRLTAEFMPAMSGTYAFRLTDETGLTGSRLLEIRLVPDPAPTVTLLRPSAGKDPPLLTPAASIPVHVASDDKLYAVRSTFLEYRVAGGDGVVRTIPLGDVRDSANLLPAVVGGSGVLARVRPPSSEARLVVSLSAFTRDGKNPLKDGDVLFLRGATDDWDEVTAAKDPGRSGAVEIRIAAPETIEAWLERELAAMRPELMRSRDQQREARQKAGEVQPQPDGSLVPADRDRLLAAEQTQRLIRGRIGDPREGLRAKAELLLETVRANELRRSNTTDRVATVADVLVRLSDRDLPVIEPTFTDARQLGSQPAKAGQEKLVPEMLKRAARHQKAVEDGLTDLLDILNVWGGAVEIRGEARVLRDFIQRQLAEIEKLERPAPAGELDRAGTRADQAADQGREMMGRATRLAAEKVKQADELRAKADEKKKEADDLRARAVMLPPGTPEKSTLNAQAALTEGEAADIRAAADKAENEAKALTEAIKAAGGQSLTEDLRNAGEAVRRDRRSDAGNSLRSAVGRLDRLIDTLTEKPTDEAPDLKKWKKGADDLDDLAAAQDDLRKRAADARNITDPARREAEFKKLAIDQERLIDRGRELFQRLNRERADGAARDVRAALDAMEAARRDLENGDPGIRPQNEAVDRLDNARDKLDQATAAAPQQLSDEKRRKMADKVKAVLEKQKAAVAEAERIHKLVATEKKWERAVLVSYSEIADPREKAVAEEIKALAKDFEQLPVLARVVAEAAKAADTAVTRIDDRVKDTDPALAFDAELETANDRRVLRPMTLAARRLEQLLEALKPDDPKRKDGKEPAPKTQPKTDPMNPPPAGGGQQDLIPPLAQLKVLRSLQAELNDRTAEFAKLYPDADKLTDEEREELKELEDSQRDIATLFEHVAKLLQEQKAQQDMGGMPDEKATEKPETPKTPAKDEKPTAPTPEKP